ncbi:hypothetical protein ACXZ9C_11235 [Streptococcus agalactiae]
MASSRRRVAWRGVAWWRSVASAWRRVAWRCVAWRSVASWRRVASRRSRGAWRGVASSWRPSASASLVAWRW